MINSQTMASLRDRDSLRKGDIMPIPKVSFVRRLDCVSKDPLGEGFPWKQKSDIGTEITADGKYLTKTSLREIEWEELYYYTREVQWIILSGYWVNL